MSQPNDPFNPAMQQFAQLGQAMAQQFSPSLARSRASIRWAGADPDQTPEPAKLTALQQEFLQQQTLLWNAMLARGKPGSEAAASFAVQAEPGDRRFRRRNGSRVRSSITSTRVTCSMPAI